jgi:DnaK suppressor protein
MERERAAALLAQERERIEQSIADLRRGATPDQDEPGDRDSEDLYQHEFDSGRMRDLEEQLAAVERAEARLAEGTYGLSVVSGEPIPDARLEAVPTAERTVAEESRLG